MKMMYGDGVLLVFGGLHNSQRAARKSCSQRENVSSIIRDQFHEWLDVRINPNVRS